MKIITRSMIDHEFKTDSGGFTGRQVELLGLEWKYLKKGWTSRLIGQAISDELYALVIEARGITKKKKKPEFVADQFDLF